MGVRVSVCGFGGIVVYLCVFLMENVCVYVYFMGCVCAWHCVSVHGVVSI